MTMMVESAYDLGVGKMIMLPTHDQSGRVHMNELILNHDNIDIFSKAADTAKKRADELGIKLHYSRSFDAVATHVEYF